MCFTTRDIAEGATRVSATSKGTPAGAGGEPKAGAAGRLLAAPALDSSADYRRAASAVRVGAMMATGR